MQKMLPEPKYNDVSNKNYKKKHHHDEVYSIDDVIWILSMILVNSGNESFQL